MPNYSAKKEKRGAVFDDSKYHLVKNFHHASTSEVGRGKAAKVIPFTSLGGFVGSRRGRNVYTHNIFTVEQGGIFYIVPL